MRIVLQNCFEQAEIDSECDGHMRGGLHLLVAAIHRSAARFACAQLCLIMVLRGVRSALTSRRASASNSCRPALFNREKVAPSDWIDSIVLETTSALLGDTATLTYGCIESWEPDFFVAAWVRPLVCPLACPFACSWTVSVALGRHLGERIAASSWQYERPRSQSAALTNPRDEYAIFRGWRGFLRLEGHLGPCHGLVVSLGTCRYPLT
jgi:hypothetical protein